MDARQEAYSKIIHIAAALVRGDGLPSEFLADHKQKTYSASRVARMSLEHRRWLKEKAVELRKSVEILKIEQVRPTIPPVSPDYHTAGPAVCTCTYPQIVYRNGSGHAELCPVHKQFLHDFRQSGSDV